MMITPLAKYETQSKLLKVRFTLITSLLIVSTRIDGDDKYGSQDTCTIEKPIERGKLLSRRPH